VRVDVLNGLVLEGGLDCLPMRTAYSYARFSTPEQETGDSERRQAKQAKVYAKEHNFELVSLGIDRGLSAYSGKSISKGILGHFIKQVEAGTIPKGSILLLESPDRFSRQQFSDAWPHFQKILKGDIEIHFTFIREVIKPEHSFGDLIKVGVDVDRSHGDSKTKVIRGRELWREKKRNAKTVTSVLPAWLKCERISKGVFTPITVIPERAKVVRKIFHLSALGKGSIAICQQLHKDGDNPFGLKDWRPTYVQKVLRNIAVLGHYQPMTRPKGKGSPRVNDGEIRENQYPAVITQGEWNAVRESVRLRTKNGESRGGCGRAGNGANLFTGLVYDATPPNVDRHMVYRGKVGGYKYDYLVTEFRPGQRLNSIPYLAFESHVLTYLTTEDWRKIVDGGTGSEAAAVIQEKIESTLADIARISRRIKLNNDLLNAEDLDAATNRRCQKQLANDETAIETLKNDLKRLQTEIDAVRGTFEPLQKPADLIKAIADLKADSEGRLKLKAALLERISKIEVYFRPEPGAAWADDVGFTVTIIFVNGYRGEMVILKSGDTLKGIEAEV
jgi:DNA invertase Pin-like site-specific DNA recombinase